MPPVARDAAIADHRLARELDAAVTARGSAASSRHQTFCVRASRGELANLRYYDARVDA
jgi:hypothetical protein